MTTTTTMTTTAAAVITTTTSTCSVPAEAHAFSSRTSSDVDRNETNEKTCQICEQMCSIRSHCQAVGYNSTCNDVNNCKS